MRRGFTLIELLAVIVILALIALITIPAVLRITENAKISSYRRSIDLYGRAINTAVQAYKSDKLEKRESYQVNFENVIPYVDYEGYDISCESKIYSDETILLTKCSIENDIVYAEKNKGFGSENYYYYTNSKKRIKALLYIEAVNKVLQGKENIGNNCKIENSNLTCNNQPIEVTGELGKPKSGTLIIENNKVTGYSNLVFEKEKVQTVEEVPQVVDEQQINTNPNSDNNQNNNNTNTQNLTNTTDNYIGYYADVDGNGIVDGVIYADLAHSKSGQWGIYNINYAQYSYNAQSNLKEYTISNKTYKANAGFGTNKIITLKPESTGDSRFYVMALNDFTEGSFDIEYADGLCENQYYWYVHANDKMNPSDTSINFGTGYRNTGSMIRIWNKNGIGEGSYPGAVQDDHDIFKHIQTKYQDGWYIPSVGEWIAFVDYLSNKTDNPLTNNSSTGVYIEDSSNYNSIYGLSHKYWTSSQIDVWLPWYINTNAGHIDHYTYSGSSFHSGVRLGYTF